mgnify:CR=1 FL=1
MKNMITMMIGIVIGAITILIILTVTGRMNYATELESQLPAVVENILCNVKIKQLYNVADNQEFTADVTEQIAKELDAQTGIVMRIMGADKEKGLFSVGVDRTFVHPNGKTGTVKCSRTVLADKLQIVEIQKYYVQFYKDADNSECYKKYCVTEGDTISAPAVPEYKDREFAGCRTTRDMRQIFHSRSNRTGIIMLSGNNIYRDTKEKQPHPISAAVKTVMHDDKSVCDL